MACSDVVIVAKDKGGTADTATVTLPRTPMYSRPLIRLAAPLALTLLFPFAVGFDWPASVRWAILVTMTLSWLGFAAWVTYSQFRRNPDQIRILREQDQLLNELRTFVSNEVDGSRSEVERARELIRQGRVRSGWQLRIDEPQVAPAEPGIGPHRRPCR